MVVICMTMVIQERFRCQWYICDQLGMSLPSPCLLNRENHIDPERSSRKSLLWSERKFCALFLGDISDICILFLLGGGEGVLGGGEGGVRGARRGGPEFAQPRLGRVKRRSSPARGYKFGCVCSYMAVHEDAGVVTGHIGTNTPKFVPPRWGRPPFDPTQTGLCKFGWVWSSLIDGIDCKSQWKFQEGVSQERG